jgi:4-carboxymuconolactone decarboxylase
MKTRSVAVAATLSVLLVGCAGKEPAAATSPPVGAVSPALERYTQNSLLGDVWKRPGLSPRDRSIVTVAVLIARNQPVEMRYHFELALDHGVKASELSEIVTHLAFYSGWANASAAAVAAKATFEKRGIEATRLPPSSGALLPLDQAAETQRAAGVEANFGAVAPGVVHYATDRCGPRGQRASRTSPVSSQSRHG